MCGIAIFRQLPQLESETSVVMSARKIAAALISAPMMTAWSIAAITPRGKSVWTCVAVYAHGRNLSFAILCFLRPFARFAVPRRQLKDDYREEKQDRCFEKIFHWPVRFLLSGIYHHLNFENSVISVPARLCRGPLPFGDALSCSLPLNGA